MDPKNDDTLEIWRMDTKKWWFEENVLYLRLPQLIMPRPFLGGMVSTHQK